MAAGWICITYSDAWNGNHSKSTRSKKQMKERGIQKHRITEREIRTKHGTLHSTLLPYEMQQKQFCLPGCTMNRSDNFSIITLEIKFK